MGLLATVTVLLVLYLDLGKTATPFYRGGVATNGHECAKVGRDILVQGGTAVDAAVAALFCEGITMPQSMGLGGGFFMTIYDHATGRVEILNSREIAPLAASENMFDGNASLAAKGGLAVAVPGELRGYWAAHQKYGRLPWATLVQPAIDICRKGHLVTPFLANLFKSQEKVLLASPTLREVFINPATNKTWPEGHHLKRLELANTLEIISRKGADALYNGELTAKFVKDIQDLGGIITEEDMRRYQPEWSAPIVNYLPNGDTMYTNPLPGTGVILAFMMNILSGFLDTKNINSVRNWQRIVEAMKYGYGKRTELGDAKFVPGIEDLLANLTSPAYAAEIRADITDTMTFQDPEHYGANTSLIEDHGTAHVCVMGLNGDAVSVTSTINLYFGAGIRSTSTGIILNDEMDDFSAPNITNAFGVPPSPSNYIVPGKRPLSSMCPTIVVDKDNNVRLVTGAAGGTKITTATALVAMRVLWFGEHLQDAINAPRLHHQLFPMNISFENSFPKDIVNGLNNIGHSYVLLGPSNGFAALTALAKTNGNIEGGTDPRRAGSIYLIP